MLLRVKPGGLSEGVPDGLHRIDAWDPEFEIAHRRIIPAAEATRYVRDPDDAVNGIHLRALVEAGLNVREPPC